TAQIAKSADCVARVEVVSWLSKARLDIIGLAYQSARAAGGTTPNDLVAAFESMSVPEAGFSFWAFLQSRLPVLRKIVRPTHPLSSPPLADSKREIAESGTVETGTGRARDLLSLLVRANTAKEMPAEQRRSDEDVIARASCPHLSIFFLDFAASG
ncbi:hypothetical protein K438DRAFT_1577173, partial [Mycena galopus ATCC 62051]